MILSADLAGAAIAYAGIGLSRNLSATAALVVTNIDPWILASASKAKCAGFVLGCAIMEQAEDKVLVLCYGVMMPLR